MNTAMSDVPRDAIELKPAKPENTASPVNNATADLIGGFSQTSSAAMSGHEGKLQNLKACKTFEPGQKLLATIKAVHKEGVLVEMPQGRGSGVISPRCWGDGEARLRALAGLRPGDEVEVCVRSYHAPTCSLSLMLAGCDLPAAQPKHSSAARCCMPKTVTKRTLFLWDTANLFGIIGPMHAVHVLEGIAKASEEQGCKAIFFMEHRALKWAGCNQKSKAEEQALWDFSRREDFLVVDDRGRSEADDIILQVAEVIPDAICVSCDRFRKYAALHPTLVGTDRVRPFSVVWLNETVILSVKGLSRPILIEAVQGAYAL